VAATISTPLRLVDKLVDEMPRRARPNWLLRGDRLRTLKLSQDEPIVYFVLAEDAGKLKIGTSTVGGLDSRMETHCGSSPVPLRLLGAIHGGVSVERWCHRYCFSSRSHREWFRWDGRVQAFVRLLLAHGDFAAERLCPEHLSRDNGLRRSRKGIAGRLPRRLADIEVYSRKADVRIGTCGCDLCRDFLSGGQQ